MNKCPHRRASRDRGISAAHGLRVAIAAICVSGPLCTGGTMEPADLSGDGIVDRSDLSVLLARWTM